MKKKKCAPPFKLSLLKVKYWGAWLGLGVTYFISFLPDKGRHAVGRFLGRMMFRFNPKRANIVRTNLKLCFPDVSDQQREEMAMASMQWYGCAIVDYSLLFFASLERLKKKISVSGKSNVENSATGKDNIILLLAHSVWLDFAPVGLSNGFQLYGSYKRAGNAVIDWMLAASRCKHVGILIAREEGMIKLVRSLEPGLALIFLPDEDLGQKHSDFAPFFGVDKATLNTPARIAKLKKATCFPVYAHYDQKSGKYCVEIGEALTDFASSSPRQSAEVLNQGLEQLIRLRPEQYMWQLKYFKTRPGGEKAPYR